MSGIMKTWKLQWPLHTSDPENPMILVYSVNPTTGEKEELFEQYQMPATPAMKRMFKKKGARPGYWTKIYVRGMMIKDELVFQSFTLKGMWL